MDANFKEGFEKTAKKGILGKLTAPFRRDKVHNSLQKSKEKYFKSDTDNPVTTLLGGSEKGKQARRMIEKRQRQMKKLYK